MDWSKIPWAPAPAPVATPAPAVETAPAPVAEPTTVTDPAPAAPEQPAMATAGGNDQPSASDILAAIRARKSE